MPGGRNPYADYGPPTINYTGWAQQGGFNPPPRGAPGAGGPTYPGVAPPGPSTGGTGGWATEFSQLLASLQPTMTQAMQAGNVDPAQQAAKFAAGQQSNLNAMIPGYSTMTGQQSGIIGQQLRGEVPMDVKRQLAQSMAERGITTGSPGSQASEASYQQAVMKTSYQIMQDAQAELNRVVALNKIDPGFLSMTPAQQQESMSKLFAIVAELGGKLQSGALSEQTQIKLQQMKNDAEYQIARLQAARGGGGGGQSGGGQRYGGGGGATGGATRGGISSVSDLLGGGGATGGGTGYAWNPYDPTGGGGVSIGDPSLDTGPAVSWNPAVTSDGWIPYGGEAGRMPELDQWGFDVYPEDVGGG